MAYDSTRTRLVALDLHGWTYEWTGEWNRVPAVGPELATMLVHDPVHRRTIALGYSSLSVYDGNSWAPLAAPSPFATTAGIAFDERRGRLVLVTSTSGFFPSTWEHDGNAWILTSQTGPSPANALTYDPVRQRVVLFGGGLSAYSLFAYDGVTWTAISPAVSTGSANNRLGFDPTRNSLVVHGSNSNRDWEWNGTNWSSSSVPLSSPYPTVCATPFGLVAVGDTAPGAVALRVSGQWLVVAPGERPQLFRGVAVDPTTNSILAVGDYSTATWDGSRWHTLAAATPRMLGAVVDLLRSRVLAFSESAAPWAWTGNAWASLGSAAGFSFREGSCCAFDLARDRALVFGGVPTNQTLSVPTDELWSWDGTAWTQLQVAGVAWPAARRDAGMVYDPVRQAVLLAGGWGNGGPLADTWQWNGATWSQQSPSVAPFAGEVAMAFDFATMQPVVAKASSTAIDLYAHDGVNWTLRSSTAMETPPSAAVWPQLPLLVFEPGSGRPLLNSLDVLRRLVDVPSHVEVQAAGCFAPIRLAPRAVPRVGAAATGVDIYGVPGPVLLGLGSSAASTPLGGGCNLLLGSIDLEFVLSAGSNGFATQLLPVPAQQAFLGLTVYAQAAQLDAASPIGIALSPRLSLTIGE